MNSMHEDLARALVEERLASARQRHLARQVRSGRSDARQAGKPFVASRWWERLLRRRPVGDTSSTVTSTGLGRMRLETILDGTAERISQSGTRAEAAILCAMSAAVGRLSPGAAAALVDWDGSEVTRLRAFSIVHGVVLRELGAHDRSRLLAQVPDSAQREAHAVTAAESACVSSASRRREGRVVESPGEAA